MGRAIELRTDYTSAELRRLAKRGKDVAQTRRLLAIAAVLDGASRAEAATVGYTTLSCSQVQFYANGVVWADLHYRVNGGGQLNVRMSQSGANATYTVSGLACGNTITYFFTYVPTGSSAATDTASATLTVSTTCGGRSLNSRTSG